MRPLRASVYAGVFVGCLGALMPACQGEQASPTATPEPPPQARRGHRPPKRRAAAEPGPRLTRAIGQSEPAAATGRAVPLDVPLQLAVGARWVVDGEGVRFTLHGPGRYAFTQRPQPALLVESGVFSLDRSGSARRGTKGLVATAGGVVRSTGPCRLVGHVGTGGLTVDLLSGSAEIDPPGVRVAAGQGLTSGQSAPAPASPGEGSVQAKVASWLASPPPGGTPTDPADALDEARVALSVWKSPTRGPTEAPLDYRGRLAEAVGERMQARRALVHALLRDRAATLTEADDEVRRRQSGAMRALAEGAY